MSSDESRGFLFDDKSALGTDAWRVSSSSWTGKDGRSVFTVSVDFSDKKIPYNEAMDQLFADMERRLKTRRPLSSVLPCQIWGVRDVRLNNIPPGRRP